MVLIGRSTRDRYNVPKVSTPVDYATAIHVSLELFRMEAYCDQPAAAYLSRFLLYQIGDCRADFPYALLLVSGGHRCGTRSRFQSFKEGPQLGYRLVLRQHILLTRHVCSFLCFFMLLPNPATSGDLRNRNSWLIVRAEFSRRFQYEGCRFESSRITGSRA